MLSVSASTSINTGALTIAGGLGVSGDMYGRSATFDVVQVINFIAPNSQGASLAWNRDGGSGVAGIRNQRGTGIGGFEFLNYDNSNTLLNVSMTLTESGNLSVTGSISKASGTFDIQHPLSENVKDRLIHSFIEGPKCDLIYRGKCNLVNGTCVINLDIVSNMTIGTFTSLCQNTDFYLQNNSGFDSVRGNINGNILTINCSNINSSDIISWLVIGERKDKFIKAWDRTDPNGRLIPEYTRM